MAEDSVPDDAIYILEVTVKGAGDRPPIYVRVLDPAKSLRTILRPIAKKLPFALDKVWVAPRSEGITLTNRFSILPIEEVPLSDIAQWEGPAATGESVRLAKIALVPQVSISAMGKPVAKVASRSRAPAKATNCGTVSPAKKTKRAKKAKKVKLI